MYSKTLTRLSLCFLVGSSLFLTAPISIAASNSSSKEVKQKVNSLPAPVLRAMHKQKVLAKNISVSVDPVDGNGLKLNFNDKIPRTPASIEKIVVSALALDILGPARVWKTQALSEAEIENGALKGDLYLMGKGDPTFTAERFWLLLDNLRARGIKDIQGDVYIDRSFFKLPKHNPFSFDGEGNRPYNLGADATLINYRSQIIQIRPDKEKGVAYLYPSPRINGVHIPESIPLSQEPCGKWRKQIQPDFSNPKAPKFLGKFPLRCGKKDFIYTSMTENAYAETVFKSFWRQAGGKWNGKLKTGKAPEESIELAVNYSLPLSQILHYLNKYSNNQIARQLFLTVGKTEKGESKTLSKSRTRVETLKKELNIAGNELYVDNGSGLSRNSKMSTRAGNAILLSMWDSPNMAEFMASLPISGVDGTMRKRKVATGYAHIKTGYIANTRSIAGFVRGKSGKFYAVTAIVNGPEALGSLPVLDAVINWIYQQG